MLQRLTDLWPGFVRVINPNEDDERQPLLGNGEDEEDDGREIDVDEDELLENYRTLNWSRLISVHQFEMEESRMWPVGPDIVEECQSVAALPRDSSSNWAPLFEPVDFNETHGPLNVEYYRLSPEDLLTWAERTIKIRATIDAKAKSCAQMVDEDNAGNDQHQRRRGYKRSRPSHNAEGRTEKDLK